MFYVVVSWLEHLQKVLTFPANARVAHVIKLFLVPKIVDLQNKLACLKLKNISTYDICEKDYRTQVLS